MKRILHFVALLTSLLSSCGDDEVTRDPEAQGHLYYPLEIGKYSIFNVTEKRYTNNVAQNTTFQIRELINEVSTDQTGKEWYRVEVSRRNRESENWTVVGVKMISKSYTDLEIKDNNRTTVAMVFPIVETKEWNPNAFNPDYNLEEDELNRVKFFYKDVAKTFILAGKTYANTVTIEQANTATQLEYEEKFEVLASGIGSVNRTNIHLFYCNDTNSNSSCPFGVEYIVTGLERTETLLETGEID